MSFNTPITTNDYSIDRVIAAGLPVVFLFFKASLVPDIKSAILNQAEEHAGDLLIALINADENPNAAKRYDIKNYPCLVTVQDGVVMSKAEHLTSNIVNQHVRYILGIGPKPEDNTTSSQKPAEGRSPTGNYQTSGNVRHGPAEGVPIEVNDANFQLQVFESSMPVLVDFWAPWCGPCRMTEPILEKIAMESSGRLLIAKINVDQNPVTSGRYGIRSIPTMMVVRNGKIIDQWSGALPEQLLRQRLAHIL